jgi:transposase
MPMNVTPHQPEDLRELRQRIRRETNAKQRDRYRAVLLALEGQPTVVIMDKLARSKNFIQRWVYAYRDTGLEAVRAAKSPGITPKLPRDQESIFLERLGEAGIIVARRAA